MREIKFRAWRDSHKDMLHFDLIDACMSNCEIYEKGHLVVCLGGGDHVRNALDKNFPIMQYTGKKDMHGREVYEEDIIKIYEPDSDFTDTVGYESGCFILKHQEIHLWWADEDCIELIGNSFESPHLHNQHS